MLAEIVSIIGPRRWIAASVVFELVDDGAPRLSSIAFTDSSKTKPRLGDWEAQVAELANVARDLIELAPHWGGVWPGRRFTLTRNTSGVTLELDDAVPPIRVGISADDEQHRLFRDDVIDMLSDSAPRSRALRDAWNAVRKDQQVEISADWQHLLIGDRAAPCQLIAAYQTPRLMWPWQVSGPPPSARRALTALRDAAEPAALVHVLSGTWIVLDESSLEPLLWTVAEKIGALGLERLASPDGMVIFVAVT